MPSPEKIFKALANQRRLSILRILLKHKELPVGDIAEKINLSFKSTSKHLQILETAGFLYRRHSRNVAYYSIAKDNSVLHSTILKLVK